MPRQYSQTAAAGGQITQKIGAQQTRSVTRAYRITGNVRIWVITILRTFPTEVGTVTGIAMTVRQIKKSRDNGAMTTLDEAANRAIGLGTQQMHPSAPCRWSEP